MKKMIVMALAIMVTATAQNAAALFQVTPSSLNYGEVLVDEVSYMTVTLTNKAASAYPNIPVTISGWTITGDTDVFKVAATGCPTTLTVGAFCNVNINFHPLVVGSKSGIFRVSTKEEGAFSVSLYGAGGSSSVLSFSRTSIDFGDVALNQSVVESVQVTNSSNTSFNLSVNSSQLVSTSTHNCNPLSAKGSCSIDLTFHPTSTGRVYRTISVTWEGGGAQSIYTTGNGASQDSGGSGSGDTGEGAGGGGCFIAGAFYGYERNFHAGTLWDVRAKILLFMLLVIMIPALSIKARKSS